MAVFLGATGRVRHPAVDGRAKAGFRPPGDLFGKRPGRRLSQRLFVWLLGFDLPEQHAIDEGHADFERVCHAGPIGVAQELIAHVEPALQGRHPFEWLLRVRVHRLADQLQRGQTLEPLAGLFHPHQPAQFPWHEEAAAHQPGPGIVTGIFGQRQ